MISIRKIYWKIEAVARRDTRKSKSLEKLSDICHACMYSDIEQQDKIAAWIKDQKKIEDSVNFFSLSLLTLCLENILYLIVSIICFLV